MSAAAGGGVLAEVLALLDAKCACQATGGLRDPMCGDCPTQDAEAAAVNYLRAHGPAVAELVAAARKVAMGRHTHSAIDAPDSEGCGLCRHNWRHEIHYRAGESAESDLAELRAALSNIEGGKA